MTVLKMLMITMMMMIPGVEQGMSHQERGGRSRRGRWCRARWRVPKTAATAFVVRRNLTSWKKGDKMGKREKVGNTQMISAALVCPYFYFKDFTVLLHCPEILFFYVITSQVPQLTFIWMLLPGASGLGNLTT